MSTTTSTATKRPGRLADPLDRSQVIHLPKPRSRKGPARAGDVLADALRAQVEALRAWEPGVRAQDPEAVTEMRVATRRLRSTLRGFTRVLASAHTRAAAEELRWLGGQLAKEHDTEVMVKRFARDVAQLPEDVVVGPVASELERSLGRLAEEGRHTIQAALDSPRYRALLDQLDQLVDHPPFTRRAVEPARVELPLGVAKAFRALNRKLDAAAALPAGADRDLAVHEARKADKRVRYMTEIVVPVVGRPARRFCRQTEKLQELLGTYQDAVMARPVLHELGARAHVNGPDESVYGLLDALQYARAERVLSKLPDRLAHLREDRTLAWLRPDLTDRPGHRSATRRRLSAVG